MNYQDKKEQIKQKAIVWQQEFEEMDLDYSKLAFWSDYFTKLGKRYGLLKEFRENAII